MTAGTLIAEPAERAGPALHVPPVLWPHQQRLKAWALARPSGMFAADMGSGKTAPAIHVADELNASRVLILCPKSVVDVWPTQFAKHSARPWRIWAGAVYGVRGLRKHPTTVQKAEALQFAIDVAEVADSPFACVCNYEAAIQPALRDVLLETEWDIIIFDESHRLKKPGGAASKLAHRIAKRGRGRGARVYALTGTPMPHSPLDLYAQYRLLDETVFGTSYVAFRLRFAQPVIKYHNADGTPVYMMIPGTSTPVYSGIRKDRGAEFTARAAPLMFQVDAAELNATLGLLEPVDQHRTCVLEGPTRKVYDDLERYLIAEIDDGHVTAANAMVNVLRLAQASNGFAIDAETGRTRKLLQHAEKTKLLADILEDLDVNEPVVIFARFHHDLDEIKDVCAEQGRCYGELSGRMRDGMTDQATMSPDIDVLGVQIQSGGLGVDLTRAHHAIYFSVSFALADYLQSRKRLHRPGQARRVVYTHLLAADTIDQAIYAALKDREDTIVAVLASLDRERVS